MVNTLQQQQQLLLVQVEERGFAALRGSQLKKLGRKSVGLRQRPREQQVLKMAKEEESTIAASSKTHYFYFLWVHTPPSRYSIVAEKAFMLAKPLRFRICLQGKLESSM